MQRNLYRKGYERVERYKKKKIHIHRLIEFVPNMIWYIFTIYYELYQYIIYCLYFRLPSLVLHSFQQCSRDHLPHQLLNLGTYLEKYNILSCSLEGFSRVLCSKSKTINMNKHIYFSWDENQLQLESMGEKCLFVLFKRRLVRLGCGSSLTSQHCACPISLSLGDQSNSALWGYCCSKT